MTAFLICFGSILLIFAFIALMASMEMRRPRNIIAGWSSVIFILVGAVAIVLGINNYYSDFKASCQQAGGTMVGENCLTINRSYNG